MCLVLGKDLKGTVFGTSGSSWLPSYMPGSQNLREKWFLSRSSFFISSCQDYEKRGSKKHFGMEASCCRRSWPPSDVGHRRRSLSRCRGGTEMGLNREGCDTLRLFFVVPIPRGGVGWQNWDQVLSRPWPQSLVEKTLLLHAHRF